MPRRLRLIIGMTALVVGIGAWAVPHLLPWALRVYRDDVVFSAEPGGRTLYLTIDDAPSDATAAILDVLDKHGVRATFFVMAGRVTAPEVLTDIVRRGHRVGNHLQTSQACSTLSTEAFKRDFDACDRLLVGAGGVPTLFRPPSDFGTREQLRYARERGYTPVLGTVFPLDHWIARPVWLRRLAGWLAVDGGIVILHDGHDRGRVTAAVLDAWLPELRAAGYVVRPLERDSLPAADR